jgi:hypothetical protein
MPEGGRYEKMPRPESIEFFKKSVLSHSQVEKLEVHGPQFYTIKRKLCSDLRLHLTNIYIVSEADVLEIMGDYPGVNCILTISSWNSYSYAAKQLAKQNCIGLFRTSEFYGALNYDGQKFLDYIPPEQREEKRRAKRR